MKGGYILLLSVFIFGVSSLDLKTNVSVESDNVIIENEYFQEIEVSDYNVKSKEIINDINNK